MLFLFFFDASLHVLGRHLPPDEVGQFFAYHFNSLVARRRVTQVAFFQTVGNQSGDAGRSFAFLGSYLFVGNLLGSRLSIIEIDPLRPLVYSDSLKDVVYTSEQC
jgi:hypothetical protein